MLYLKLKDFLNCPDGVVFQEIGNETSRIVFDLSRKEETWENDFLYSKLTPDWEFVDGKEQLNWTDDISRWGSFDETAMFMVYEPKDLERLSKLLLKKTERGV